MKYLETFAPEIEGDEGPETKGSEAMRIEWSCTEEPCVGRSELFFRSVRPYLTCIAAILIGLIAFTQAVGFGFQKSKRFAISHGSLRHLLPGKPGPEWQ